MELMDRKWIQRFEELRQMITSQPIVSSNNEVFSSVRANLTQPKKDVEFVIHKNMEVPSWDEVDVLMNAWALQNHIDVTVKRSDGEGLLGRTRKTYCCKHCGKAPVTSPTTTKIGCPFAVSWQEKTDSKGNPCLRLTTLHAPHNHEVGPGKAVLPRTNPYYRGSPKETKRRKMDEDSDNNVTNTLAPQKRIQPNRAKKANGGTLMGE